MSVTLYEPTGGALEDLKTSDPAAMVKPLPPLPPHTALDSRFAPER